MTGGVDQKPFLIYDNGVDAQHRILVFATTEGLQHLASCQHWFADGNFAVAPKVFDQLYIIRAPLADSSVTCVYALLQGKLRSVYEEMFQAILAKGQDLGLLLQPTCITADFELVSVFLFGMKSYDYFTRLAVCSVTSLTTTFVLDMFEKLTHSTCCSCLYRPFMTQPEYHSDTTLSYTGAFFILLKRPGEKYKRWA